MKLLIINSNKRVPAHRLREHHVTQIKESFPEVEVEVVEEDEVTPEQATNADIFAGFPKFIPKLHEGMKVKWIHAFSAGVDSLLTPEVRVNNEIVITNSSGIHAIPIAEHIIGLIIAFNKKFPVLFRNQPAKVWERQDGVSELHGKTVIVVGLGKIGSKVATLLKAFDCKVHGVVRSMRERPEYVDKLLTLNTMHAALAQADYVIICLPGNVETDSLFNVELFEQMKESTVVVNIGRGSIINQEDLINALKNKVIGGALLDVTTPEPLPEESPLWKMQNVIITPHCSASNPYTTDRAVDRLCVNLKAFLKGEPMPNEVNKELGY